MANHPNRNWRRRWMIDRKLNQATHDSGLLVDFNADNGEPWAVIVPDELLTHITLDKARKLSRLMKEANELWKEQDTSN